MNNQNPKNKYPLSNVVEYNYSYNPTTSIIIHCFTSPQTALKTIENLRHIKDEIEIILVCDNPKYKIDFNSELNLRNDRIIISNDIGECRGYSAGARISNATDYLIFTQDDDLAPLNSDWYYDVKQEFNLNKNLGIVGLNKGGINYGQRGETTQKFKLKPGNKIHCSWLATGPLIVRKNYYENVGGWSMDYSEIGEADGGADADLATKFVLKDYDAIYLKTHNTAEWKRRHDRGDGFTKKDIIKIKPRQKRIELNDEIYLKKYHKHNSIINEKIHKSNSLLISK